MKAGNMILLDTNVLVYAADKNSEYHSIALPIVQKALSGESAACLCLQNLIEFYATVTSKKVDFPLSPELAMIEINKYFNNPHIVKVHFNETALKMLAHLTQKYKTIGQNIYDLKILATMLTHGVGEIATANESDFQQFSEIKILNPFKKYPPFL